MRTASKAKSKPHPKLVRTGTNSVRLTAVPNRADAQRVNLKRAYQAFMRALPSGGESAAKAAPSVAWPNRPYAASL